MNYLFEQFIVRMEVKMIKLNDNISKIVDENEFSSMTTMVNEMKKNNPEFEYVSLGIGDVSRPIIKEVAKAMQNAVDDLSKIDTFKGYGSSYGYSFLKEKILKNEYSEMPFTEDELYISNGTKPDSTSILELFDIHSKICAVNPIYPVYKNGALCLNRNVDYINSTEESGFIPKIPNEKYDIIYLCSPNNPTGIAYTYDDLKSWVDYAIQNNSVILYDNVYYSFIRSKNVPKSIYEVKGADKVAIEFRSFSKNLSFTGVRCSYYIIPNSLQQDINKIWQKRTINRFNGVDYIAQKGAEASYLDVVQRKIKENIDYYLSNARYLKQEFIKLGFTVYGGDDSPFIWVKIKEKLTSLEVFKLYLTKLNIIITPGIVFGSEGDKFFRVSSLGDIKDLEKAIERLKKYYEK